MKILFRLLALIGVVVVVAGGWLAWSLARSGLHARVPPSRIEALMSRAFRSWATPSAVRRQPNPVAPTAEVLDEALQHFADHCASCHANDGSGNIALGRSFYPPAPDMRIAPTQDLTDGELFSIIENGIRLTGMPAWGDGTDEGRRSSWGLVHFIRRLPQLTDEDLARMEEFNPKAPAQFREEEEARRFLEGQ